MEISKLHKPRERLGHPIFPTNINLKSLDTVKARKSAFQPFTSMISTRVESLEYQIVSLIPRSDPMIDTQLLLRTS